MTFRCPPTSLFWALCILYWAICFSPYFPSQSAASVPVPRTHKTYAMFYVMMLFVPLWLGGVLISFPNSPIWVVLSIFPITAPVQTMLQVGRVGYPGLADRDQYCGIRAFSHRGAIPLYKDLQVVYVDVWEKTEFSRNYPGIENCLRPVHLNDTQNSPKVQRHAGSVRCFIQFIDGICFEYTSPGLPLPDRCIDWSVDRAGAASGQASCFHLQ